MDQNRIPAPVARHGDEATAAETALLTPRLQASWKRSRRYGLTPEDLRPDFTGTVDTESLLYECGHEVLQGLKDTLAGEPVGMTLTNSDGLVLFRLCGDSSVSRSLDRVNLAPGFSFSESNAGTNGMGLALADRAPSLVRAEEHYCTLLRQYTCAAVPVLDPLTGELAGSVNLTTWSDRSSKLLLALAQAAAGNTAALMLARTTGRKPRPAPRGEVFQVFAHRARPGNPPPVLSSRWTDAVAEARTALAEGRLLAVVGEPGTGKSTLAALARRQVRSRERILCARPPLPGDITPWMRIWAPELAKTDTCVIITGVHTLPAWAAEDLAELLSGGARGNTADQHPYPHPAVITAEDYASIPQALRSLVGAVVEAPTLRSRPDDILPLADHFARGLRGRPVTFSPAAAQALTTCHWPENTRQLRRIVCDAASRTDVVDLRHLPGEVFVGTPHRLSRIQALERDEIIRCLTEPATTVAQAADALGMSRATIYRKIAQYDITIPSRTR